MLKAHYAIAIAFLVVAFVGFGISAFYPEPRYPTGYPDDAQRTPPDQRTPEQREIIEEYNQK